MSYILYMTERALKVFDSRSHTHEILWRYNALHKALVCIKYLTRKFSQKPKVDREQQMYSH